MKNIFTLFLLALFLTSCAAIEKRNEIIDTCFQKYSNTPQKDVPMFCVKVFQTYSIYDLPTN